MIADILNNGYKTVATVLIPSMVYIMANLIADIAAILFTPRLRTA